MGGHRKHRSGSRCLLSFRQAACSSCAVVADDIGTARNISSGVTSIAIAVVIAAVPISAAPIALAPIAIACSRVHVLSASDVHPPGWRLLSNHHRHLPRVLREQCHVAATHLVTGSAATFTLAAATFTLAAASFTPAAATFTLTAATFTLAASAPFALAPIAIACSRVHVLSASDVRPPGWRLLSNHHRHLPRVLREQCHVAATHLVTGSAATFTLAASVQHVLSTSDVRPSGWRLLSNRHRHLPRMLRKG